MTIALRRTADHLPPRDPRGGRPTQEMAERLRTHILATALDEFGRYGVEGASMDRIAATAKVSKRTLYARFTSKLNLLIAAIQYGIEQHLRPISSTLSTGPVRERLLDVARKILDSSLTPEAVRLENLFAWIAEHDPDLHEVAIENAINGPVRMFLMILEDGRREGEIHLPDPSFTANFVFEALVAVPRKRILLGMGLKNTPRDKRIWLTKTLDLLLAGLSRAPEAGTQTRG